MKKILFGLLLLPFLVVAQNKEECRAIAGLTVKCINEGSAKKITPLLAHNFTIADHKGAIAKMIVKQLFSQINDSVVEYELTEEGFYENNLQLTYKMVYEKMGEKQANLVFDSDNKIVKLDLFKMKVEVMKQAEIKKETASVVRIPFHPCHKLIAVDVLLNGEKKLFLLDSGSPLVILNAAHVTDGLPAKNAISTAKGVNGNINNTSLTKIKKLEWNGIEINDHELLTIDLSHLEKELDTEIYGLIGYEFIKDYDVLFDYPNEEIVLINPEYYEDFIKTELTGKNITAIPLTIQQHIPVVEAEINGKLLNLGIDCGAESNLMDLAFYKQFEKYMNNFSSDSLSGADGAVSVLPKAEVSSTLIGTKEFENMETLFTDMKKVNEGYDLQIDGLIGYELLSKQKTILRFAAGEMMLVN